GARPGRDQAGRRTPLSRGRHAHADLNRACGNAVRSLAIEALIAHGFRNLTHVHLELGPRFNVVSGDNGQGKTNLLEAIYMVATSKSFRTSKLGELVGFGADPATGRT